MATVLTVVQSGSSSKGGGRSTWTHTHVHTRNSCYYNQSARKQVQIQVVTSRWIPPMSWTSSMRKEFLANSPDKLVTLHRGHTPGDTLHATDTLFLLGPSASASPRPIQRVRSTPYNPPNGRRKGTKSPHRRTVHMPRAHSHTPPPAATHRLVSQGIGGERG